MEEQLLSHLAGNVGVPALLCFYALYCVKSQIERLTERVEHLSFILTARIEKLEHDVEELKRAPS